MPEYTFQCDKCSNLFSEVWCMAEYDHNILSVKCPECNSKKVRRDYETDHVSSHYVFGLSECKTIGHYAEKQTKIYGKEKCEKMRESFKTKKNPNTGMKELPSGMSRMKSPEDMPAPLTKTNAKRKKGNK